MLLTMASLETASCLHTRRKTSVLQTYSPARPYFLGARELPSNRRALGTPHLPVGLGVRVCKWV